MHPRCLSPTKPPLQLHSAQVAAGGNCSQHALRQTLGLLRGAAAARPVRLPGVTLVTVTAAFESAYIRTGKEQSHQQWNGTVVEN